LGSSDTGTGVQGTGGARGVYGFSSTGEGVYGLSAGSAGVEGASINSVGVRGTYSLNSNKGELGTAGEGVYGVSTTGDGVRGESSGSNKSGVYGVNNQSDGYGVYGRNTGGGYGVYSNGDLYVDGAYKGGIGPNGGAPFPRPAYDSGWVNIGAYLAEVTLNPGLPVEHFNNDSFVVDLRFKNVYSSDPCMALYYAILTDNRITVGNRMDFSAQFRMRVWYIY